MATSRITNRPVSGMDLPRYAGICTFMRLPHVPPGRAGELDIALIGLPWDGGTTTRGGARYAPRQIREMSQLLRGIHPTTGVNPYALANCGDVGDAPTNPVDLLRSLKQVEDFVAGIVARQDDPLVMAFFAWLAGHPDLGAATGPESGWAPQARLRAVGS